MEKRIIGYEELEYMEHRLIRFAKERYRLSKNNRVRIRCLAILLRLFKRQDIRKSDLDFLTSWASSPTGRILEIWLHRHPAAK